MTPLPSRIRIALLGLWVGAASLFSFVVAPSAFKALPTAMMAGSVVSRVLAGVEILGLIVGVSLLIALLIGRRREPRGVQFELIVSSLLTLAMAISHFFVSPRLRAMRTQYGDISALPAEDALRASFNLMHQASVGLLSFALFAGLAMLAVLLWRDAQPEKRDVEV